MEVPSPSCPRCDYDLSGEVSRWNHAESEGCPLTGTCTECGLNIDWKFVLVPHLAGQPWFVESARKRVIYALLQTAVRALRPWKFWSDVLLEFRIAPGRLAIFLLLLLAAPLVLRSLLGIVDGLLRNAITPTSGMSYVLYLKQSSAVFIGNMFSSRIGVPLWLLAMPALVFGMPLMFLLLPWTRALSKVRVAHVMRIAVYSTAWMTVFVWLSLGLKLIQIGHDVFHVVMTGSVLKPRWNFDSPWYIDLDPLATRTPLGWSYRLPGLQPLGTTVLIIYVLLFWWFALSRGMRMRDHRAAFLACAIPTLIAAGLCMCFHQGFLP